MKKTFGILALLFLLASCKKDTGTMKYIGLFTTSIEKSANLSHSDSLYTIFGDYITSITPSHFACRLNMLVFQDRYQQSDPNCHMISFVDGNDTVVDFSGNAEIEFQPILHSTDIHDGLFEQKEVDFKFLTFTPHYFIHDFEIPIEYLGFQNDSNFLHSLGTIEFDSQQNKLFVHSTKQFSYAAIHGYANGMPSGFALIFGETDSSYIYWYTGNTLPENERFPFWDQEGMGIIRSNNFTTKRIIMPEKGHTNTMYSTISINTTDIIQIYAGLDNIPYTVDDVFVYAPHFWNRVTANLETIAN
jgi:hypothetical protein